MDPFSFAASIITVIGATKTGINGIKKLRGTPHELDDLLADISQFEVVLEAVQNIPARDNADSELERLLESGSKKMLELNSLVQYQLTKAGESSKVDRLQWIRSGHDVERLRGQLRDIRANIVALIGVNMSTTVHRVSQVTDQILSENRENREINSQMVAIATKWMQLLEGSPTSRAAIAASMGDVRQLTIESSPQADDTVDKKSTAQQLSQEKLHLDPQSKLCIRRVRTITICSKSCACKCHLRRRIGAPGIFSKVTGRGYIETAGPSLFGTNCDLKLCRARVAPRVSIQYCLPQWLITRMVLMWFTSSPPYAPEFVLRLPQVRDSRSNKAFKAVMVGNLDLLKAAFDDGDCTPYDVDVLGDTLLSYAVQISHLQYAAPRVFWEILVYLSAYGDSTNRSTITPRAERVIWETFILSPFRKTFGRQRMLRFDLFPMIEWECYIESQSFTMLHQIVCGLSRRSLDIELQSSNNIDELDKDNRSALWYSVAHGHREHVLLLLERGADPNVGDPPITRIRSVRSAYEITKALIEHGATPNFSNDREFWSVWESQGSQDLWYLLFAQPYDDIAIDKLLIDWGIDINHRAVWDGVEDVTILMRLSDSYYSRAHLGVQQLIELGADLEKMDQKGESAIMYALRKPCPESFEVLARAGARLDVQNTAGNTILHTIILRTWDYRRFVKLYEVLLHNVDFTMLDLHARNADGHTALDLLKLRNGLKWEGYCESKEIQTVWISQGMRCLFREEEIPFIHAMENLFKDIQDAQGVAEEDRYPPLGEYLSGNVEHEAVPGAWPVG